jgi:1-deoxy-D-xylulose-5-phosphate reductoisomerase
MTGKRISIWGSTGSIGTQALDVIGGAGDRFEIHSLAARSNASLLFEQSSRFRPRTAVIAGVRGPDEWDGRFRSIGVELLRGREGLLDAAARGTEDMVLNALVGAVGLEATLAAVRAGVSIALANKEVLVMAGELVMRELRGRNLSILPVDSEHSAVFQCLQGEDPAAVRTLVLTASGGPFLNAGAAELERVTVDQALAHPNWSMGKKVTIDSATLINKGLEVIEARWLFGLPAEAIKVVIHPQSIVHSMVEFHDGSIKAQLGMPDMRIPIAYALTYPERRPQSVRRMDFDVPHSMSFLPPDLGRFPGLRLAYDALRIGGTATAVYNAADEEAVRLFLEGRIRFPQIPRIVEQALERHRPEPGDSLAQILDADRWTRDLIHHDNSKGIP